MREMGLLTVKKAKRIVECGHLDFPLVSEEHSA